MAGIAEFLGILDSPGRMLANSATWSEAQSQLDDEPYCTAHNITRPTVT